VDNDIFIAEIPLTDHVPEKSNVGGLNGGLSGGLSGGLKIELNETQQKVFLEITKRPGVMIKELSGRLQMPIDTLEMMTRQMKSVIQQYMQRMNDNKLVIDDKN
jgi:ATP-dependent DNA helicase RecG